MAPEGINGSICGTRESVERVLSFIQSDERLKGLRMVESPVTPEDEAIHHGHTSSSPLGAGDDAPFRWDHVRVKLKKEVIKLCYDFFQRNLNSNNICGNCLAWLVC